MQGSAIPYLAIYYDQALHLSSDQIGILLAIAPFIQSVACPVWTMVADKWPQWHGALMAVLALIGGSAIVSMSLLPSLLVGKTDLTMPFTCILALLYAFFGSPLMALVDSAVLKILGDHKILYGKADCCVTMIFLPANMPQSKSQVNNVCGDLFQMA